MKRRPKIRQYICRWLGHLARPFRKPTHSFTTCRLCNHGICRCADCKRWVSGTTRNRCRDCYEAHIGSPAWHRYNEEKMQDLADDPYERDCLSWTTSPDAVMR